MKELIYDLIPQDRFITRKELCELTGEKDRSVRRYISLIRKEHNIISLSSLKGYKRPKSTNDMTQQEIEEEYKIIKKQLRENNSRIKKIKYNMKSQIAYLKMLEKSMREGE